MRFAVHVLGTEVLAITTGQPAISDDERGDCTTSVAGFVPPEILPIREPGRDHEEW